MIVRLGMALLAVSGLAGAVHGAIIYDNGEPDRFAILASDTSPMQSIADDFTLQSGANVITDVHWWGAYQSGGVPANDDFTIYFYEQSGGAPSATAFAEYNVGSVSRVDSGVDFSVYDVYYYSVDIAPLTLDAGVTYYLSIVNNTTAPGSIWDWSTNIFGSSTGFFYSSPTSGGWAQGQGGYEMAFQLTDDNVTTPIPEPATMSLFGIGLAGLVLRRRTRV